MRIIAGEYGGIRINPPSKMPYTRPTTDVAKEGLFNMLQHNIEMNGIKTLDLFAGTGSISYELASRGAANLTVVEKDNQMYEFIKKTVQQFSPGKFRVIKSDVFRFIDQCVEKFDFIFAGPPYSLGNMDDLPRLIFAKGLISKKGKFVLEHTLDSQYRDFPFFDLEKKYGSTVFSVFVNP